MYTVQVFVRFFSLTFLNGNFHLLGYICDVTQYTVLPDHPVCSVKYVAKAFSTFLHNMRAFGSFTSFSRMEEGSHELFPCHSLFPA